MTDRFVEQADSFVNVSTDFILGRLDVVSKTDIGGRNLLIPSDVTTGYTIDSKGSIIIREGTFLTDFIEVKADEVYTITMLLQKYGHSRVAYYDLDKNFIKRDFLLYQEVLHIKPEQDGFIRWSPDPVTSIVDYDNLLGTKIEKGRLYYND